MQKSPDKSAEQHRILPLAALTLLAFLFSSANTPAAPICNDRSPAVVAETLGIDLKQKPQYRTGKPNVIIIIADDMGYGDPSSYGGDIPTPNIDRIVNGGVKFTAGYAASSICSPSRAGLVTGKQPNTLGYTRSIVGREYTLPRGLPLSEKTIADRFKAAGYTTGMIGKWHLGSNEKRAPGNRGFDEYWRLYHTAGGYYPEKYQPRVHHNLDQDLLSRMRSCKNNEKYLTDVQGLEGTAFVLRHRDDPFLLYLSFDAPHVPLQPRKESRISRLAYYRHPGYVRNAMHWRKRAYFRMVMQLDEAVGHVLDAVDLLGLSENTLIWFFSDNGGHTWGADVGVLRGHKGNLYEGGIRVPFALRWQGAVAPAVYDWPVTMLDVLPTSLAAIGVPHKTPGLSGRNLLPYLTAKSTPPNQSFFWRLNHKNERRHKSAEAIRDGEWKLIIHSDRNVPWKSELYNLRRDISEQTNLAEKEPRVFQTLAKKLNAWVATLPEPLW